MAMRKALVSTSIGAEGLDVTSGKDCLIADDGPSFASAILGVLRDPALRRRYEDNAAALAARYDWSQIARRFAEALGEAVNDPRTPNRPSSAALPV
jgi:glycosyltransferase involved in cell wall biosynthesis